MGPSGPLCLFQGSFNRPDKQLEDSAGNHPECKGFTVKLERKRRGEEAFGVGRLFDEFALDRLDGGSFSDRGFDDEEAVRGDDQHLPQPFMKTDRKAVDLFMGIENSSQCLVFSTKSIEVIYVEFASVHEPI